MDSMGGMAGQAARGAATASWHPVMTGAARGSPLAGGRPSPPLPFVVRVRTAVRISYHAAKPEGNPIMTHCRLPTCRRIERRLLVAFMACTLPPAALAQAEGGLYVAGAGFSFEQAASDGLSRNPGGQRFFLLALPPQTDALTARASTAQAAARQRVTDGNGVLLVCQRDLDNGAIDPSKLVRGVVAVRGWPPAGSNDLPSGQRYFPDENPDNLPQSTEMLRRLRSTCS
jgi:hypothetical protein